MVVVRDGCILCGDVGGCRVRVMSERQWGFVLVCGEVHGFFFSQGMCEGGKDCVWEDVVPCFAGPSFMFVWALLLRRGIGNRSRRLVLGRVSDAPQVPRCCHSWGSLSTLLGNGVCALGLAGGPFVFPRLRTLLLHR